MDVACYLFQLNYLLKVLTGALLLPEEELLLDEGVVVDLTGLEFVLLLLLLSLRKDLVLLLLLLLLLSELKTLLIKLPAPLPLF